MGDTLNWHLYAVVCASKGREHRKPVVKYHSMAMMRVGQRQRKRET